LGEEEKTSRDLHALARPNSQKEKKDAMTSPSRLLFAWLCCCWWWSTPCLAATEKELVPGAVLQEVSTPGVPMFYHFTTAANKTQSPFETMIVRVVRATRFTKDTE
jgi:hypothetical protein